VKVTKSAADGHTVVYDDLLNDDRSAVTEDGVPLARLRPLSLAERTSGRPLSDYKKGEAIEVLHEEGWWEGHVRTPGARAIVLEFASNPGEMQHVSNPALLRRGFTWTGSAWTPAPAAQRLSGPITEQAALYPPASPTASEPEVEPESPQAEPLTPEIVRAALLPRSRLLALRSRLSPQPLQSLLVGSLVRVHPPSNQGYVVLTVGGLAVPSAEDVLKWGEALLGPYACPEGGPLETRRLQLTGDATAAKHAYAFTEVSDTPASEEEVNAFLALAAKGRGRGAGVAAALRAKAEALGLGG